MRDGPRYERINSMEGSETGENHQQAPADLDTGSTETIDTQASTTATPSESPPPYNLQETGQPTHDVSVPNENPPMYSEVVKLPSYEEVELNHREREIQRYFGFADGDSDEMEESGDKIGSDFGFILCFILAFLMNWLGFIVGYCFTNTLASHYGALSGFGLSMVKWAFIIRHADCCREYLTDQPWVMWLFAIFGWLIFIRGALAYLQLKRLSRMNGQVQLWGWGI